MRATNFTKVRKLSDSWINGNRTHVRKQVKNITKLEFYFLVSEICSLTNDDDEERTANSLVGNF